MKDSLKKSDSIISIAGFAGLLFGITILLIAFISWTLNPNLDFQTTCFVDSIKSNFREIIWQVTIPGDIQSQISEKCKDNCPALLLKAPVNSTRDCFYWNEDFHWEYEYDKFSHYSLLIWTALASFGVMIVAIMMNVVINLIVRKLGPIKDAEQVPQVAIEMQTTETKDEEEQQKDEETNSVPENNLE
jgi:hypothetical protein